MKRLILVLIINTFLNAGALAKHHHLESWYQDKYCKGQKEARLADDTRVDCLMEEYAIEFDFAKKWAECIGQALFYAEMTGKKPVCFLIIENKEKDLKHLHRLQFIAPKNNIQILHN